MTPLTKEEQESFAKYARQSMTEPDGSQSQWAQWADYTLRMLDELDRLREEVKALHAEIDRVHAQANERIADLKDIDTETLALREENARVRMEVDGLRAHIAAHDDVLAEGVRLLKNETTLWEPLLAAAKARMALPRFAWAWGAPIKDAERECAADDALRESIAACEEKP